MRPTDRRFRGNVYRIPIRGRMIYLTIITLWTLVALLTYDILTGE
jgi:hypothetical protein